MATHPHIAATVELLNRLQQLLYPQPRSLDIVTVEDIQRRYPLTGLGLPAMRAIEQSQRIVRSSSNFHLIGLCEFHVGLIFLNWEDSRGASQQFAEARRQWSFVNATAAVCLSLFAEGRAQEIALHQESAMTCYVRAEQRLPRIRFDQGEDGMRHFAGVLAQELAQAKTALRHLLQEGWREQEPASAPRGTPQAARPGQTVAPMPQQVTPIPMGAFLRWYRAERLHDGFEPNLVTGAYVGADPMDLDVSPDELVVVGLHETAVSAHVILFPYQHQEPFTALYLARLAPPEPQPRGSNGPALHLDLGGGPVTAAGRVVGRVSGYWLAK